MTLYGGAASGVVMPSVDEFVDERAVFLSRIEPVCQQYQPMPVIVQAARIVWQVTRHYRQAQRFRVAAKACDGLFAVCQVVFDSWSVVRDA